MNEQKAPPAKKEESLLKLYTELTGASELCARSVLIHLCVPKAESTLSSNQIPLSGQTHMRANDQSTAI